MGPRYDLGHGQWLRLDRERWGWFRLSTALPGKTGRWHHREACPVQSGKECTCEEAKT